MNFRESENYLYSLGNEVAAMKLGLDSIAKLLTALGDPQNNYLKVQIAGTNGKGSVCAFLRSICFEAGIRAGVFTSPHLISITERINIAGVDISEDEFAGHATRVRKTAERLVADGDLETIPTFFEQLTAIALVAFADAEVELAILETGLGGRLDATTAVYAEIAAITRIDLDHQQYLGETIEEIAAEKAAIIRADTQAVVIGEQIPEAAAVIRDRCEQFGIDARLATQVRTTCGSGWLNFETDQVDCRVEKLGLPGRHQIENAKVAILLVEEMRSKFSIRAEYTIRGLENARHSGRLEYLPPNFLLDGAHNVGGAKALRDYLDEFEKRPTTIIFGAMNDKNVAEIIEILEPKAENFVFTRPDNERALTSSELADFVSDAFEQTRVFQADNVVDAISTANEITGEDGLILVTGSLYLVGEARKILIGQT